MEAVFVLLGVVVGAALPYVFENRRAAKDRYDAAITALAQVQAYRVGVGLNVPRHYTKTINDEAHAKIEQELSIEGLRRWLETNAASKGALAALYPYSADLKRYWDRFELNDAEFHEVIKTLRARRRHPLRRYGKDGNHQIHT